MVADIPVALREEAVDLEVEERVVELTILNKVITQLTTEAVAVEQLEAILT